jgi:hypothetical protein
MEDLCEDVPRVLSTTSFTSIFPAVLIVMRRNIA